MHHPGWVFLLIGGGVFGWIWKRFHHAFLDHRSAVARLKGARSVLRREALWTAGFLVIAFLVLRALV